MHHFNIGGWVEIDLAGKTQKGALPFRKSETGEYAVSEQAVERTDGVAPRTPQEVSSICHDVMTARHAWDYQELGTFLLTSIWIYLAIESTVLEIQNGEDVFSHVYTACQAADVPMIFLVARNGRMMWGKPTSSTTATNWGDGLSDVGKDRAVTRPVANWKHRVEVTDGTCTELLHYGHFGLGIKAGLANLSVGTWAPSPASGNASRVYSNVFLGGRKEVIERPWAGAFRDE